MDKDEDNDSVKSLAGALSQQLKPTYLFTYSSIGLLLVLSNTYLSGYLTEWVLTYKVLKSKPYR